MTERRLLFGSVAEQYDSYRPSYPQQLIDEVLSLPGTPEEELNVLEVGAGTGIATRQFAPRVARMTAIEPDLGMAAAAAGHAQAPANVTAVQGDFERAAAQLEPGSFDLLISATAWHWVTPELRNGLAADMLRPGGVLAAFWNGPAWSRSGLRRELDAIYHEIVPKLQEHDYGVMHPGNAGGPESRRQLDLAEGWEKGLADEPRLAEPEVHTYYWTLSYSAEEYCGLLGTHSDHLLLAPEARARLLEAIAALIDGPGGGTLELPYRAILCVARRVPIT